jgi:HSP20 family protein
MRSCLHNPGDQAPEGKEFNMVESNEANRFWPHLYEPFNRLGTRLKDWLSPASDASSSNDSYRISIELPGVAEDDIELNAETGLLTVSGEKTETREEKGDTWYFSERQYGAFRRSFRLPEDADVDRTKAILKNGVLDITVPRRSVDQAKGKKISVSKG